LRLKEIGIRKVLGASVSQVVALLTRGYFLLLVVAFILAIPASVYAVNNWLSGFAYRIEVSPSIFIVSILTIVLIAIISVSFQSIKAALTNPVNVLKDE
jgi:putative ABC transport system permease protein